MLQGNTFLPYLFVIVIDYCMRKAVNGDECGAAKIGLFINDIKTKVVTLNLEHHLQSRSGEAIKNVEDFIYIGS